MYICISEGNLQRNEQVLAYADDVALIVDTIQELQDVTSSWLSTMTNKGMSINMTKGNTEKCRT